jgi:hypothetical protein
MYVLVHNQIVINGPRPWNYRSFQNTLLEDLNINFSLPFTKTDDEPIEIADGVRILKATTIMQNFNSRIEYLHGPFWNFDNNIATGTYQIVEKDINVVKNDLKNRLATNRYRKETGGIKMTLQGIQVTIDTRRGDRDIFLQKLMMMGDGDTVDWKFPEGWLTLTKTELQLVVATGAAHVQGQFNWEASVSAQIDAATTLAELDAIDIGDPPIPHSQNGG